MCPNFTFVLNPQQHNPHTTPCTPHTRISHTSPPPVLTFANEHSECLHNHVELSLLFAHSRSRKLLAIQIDRATELVALSKGCAVVSLLALESQSGIQSVVCVTPIMSLIYSLSNTHIFIDLNQYNLYAHTSWTYSTSAMDLFFEQR